MLNIEKEEPKYGWYVRNLVIGFNIIGFLGLIAIILGFIMLDFLGILFLIIGFTLAFLFLWPGLGMLLGNLLIFRRIGKSFRMSALYSIKEPQILDIGCGTGRTALKIAKYMPNGGHLYGIDIYEKFAISGNALHTIQKNAIIEKVDHKTTFQYGTATEIPFENNKFDIVNLSSVLHEIHGEEEKKKAMKEIYRVLKPGGYLYVGEWNRISWQLIAFSGITCLVFKKKEYWEDLLKKHNFKDIKNENLNGFISFTAIK